MIMDTVKIKLNRRLFQTTSFKLSQPKHNKDTLKSKNKISDYYHTQYLTHKT